MFSGRPDHLQQPHQPFSHKPHTLPVAQNKCNLGAALRWPPGVRPLMGAFGARRRRFAWLACGSPAAQACGAFAALTYGICDGWGSWLRRYEWGILAKLLRFWGVEWATASACKAFQWGLWSSVEPWRAFQWAKRHLLNKTHCVNQTRSSTKAARPKSTTTRSTKPPP